MRLIIRTLYFAIFDRFKMSEFNTEQINLVNIFSGEFFFFKTSKNQNGKLLNCSILGFLGSPSPSVLLLYFICLACFDKVFYNKLWGKLLQFFLFNNKLYFSCIGIDLTIYFG